MACLEAAHGNPKDPEMASGLDHEPDDNAKHAKEIVAGKRGFVQLRRT